MVNVVHVSLKLQSVDAGSGLIMMVSRVYWSNASGSARGGCKCGYGLEIGVGSRVGDIIGDVEVEARLMLRSLRGGR